MQIRALYDHILQSLSVNMVSKMFFFFVLFTFTVLAVTIGKANVNADYRHIYFCLYAQTLIKNLKMGCGVQALFISGSVLVI
jgi:hypothetical protein